MSAPAMQPPDDNPDRTPAAATASGSVELRVIIEGECDCGTPRYDGHPSSPHQHYVATCDWGRIENPSGDHRYGIKHLILITRRSFTRALIQPISGRPPGKGAVLTAYTDDGRNFLRLHINDQEWTWELFDAHWADGKGAPDIMIGRWPD